MRTESSALLAWYDENARVLPWRSEPTPYRVWVSEIMLQQTRVEAGRGYFLRFMEELPDVYALANVSDEKLMKLWEGLGYYNRARNLKKAAGVIVEKHRGRIPSEWKELLALPGIGPYTGGAVASIAFGEVVPAVDGNVLRVFSRLFEYEGDILTTAARKWAEEKAMEMMPQDRPGDFNQALMELGATVCIPNGEPKCGECPFSWNCEAFNKGRQKEFPIKKAKKERRIEERTILLVEEDGRILLHKRQAKGLLAGLWEFPGLTGKARVEEVCQEIKKLGKTVKELVPAGEAIHIFSHIEWHMQGYYVKVGTEKDPREEGLLVAEAAGERDRIWTKDVQDKESSYVFVDREALFREYALPSAFRFFTEQLREGQKRGDD